jgi:hypothetical protein
MVNAQFDILFRYKNLIKTRWYQFMIHMIKNKDRKVSELYQRWIKNREDGDQVAPGVGIGKSVSGKEMFSKELNKYA